MVDRINAVLAKVVAIYDRDEDDDTDNDGDGDATVYNESDYDIVWANLKVASFGIYESTGRVYHPELTIIQQQMMLWMNFFPLIPFNIYFQK